MLTKQTRLRPVNADEPVRLKENAWGAAIEEWLDGNTIPFEKAIRDVQTLPEFVRDFLIDLAAGLVEKPSRAPRLRARVERRRIVGEVFAEWERLVATSPDSRLNSPKARACEIVGQQFQLTDSQVRGIVDREKVNGQKLTLARWVAQGRPWVKHETP